MFVGEGDTKLSEGRCSGSQFSSRGCKTPAENGVGASEWVVLAAETVGKGGEGERGHWGDKGEYLCRMNRLVGYVGGPGDFRNPAFVVKLHN